MVRFEEGNLKLLRSRVGYFNSIMVQLEAGTFFVWLQTKQRDFNSNMVQIV